MEFVFASSDAFEASSLRQGDLLIRNAAVEAVLNEAHQYYATAPDYSHFVVVTQSCDLVRRGKKPPKANYITLAAVRPFSVLLGRFLDSFVFRQGEKRFGVYDLSRRLLAEQFLERMLNNEEKGYFFFRRESHPSIKEDLCAFLSLSVALRAGHYNSLLSAKVAQLDDLFAAKLGWLVGTMHSRIATPDIDEKTSGNGAAYKEAFYKEKLDDEKAWVSSTRWRSLVKEMKRSGKIEEPTFESAREALEEVPDDMDFLANRVAELLYNSSLIERTAERRSEVVNALRNDANLRSIAKAMLK